MKKISLFSIFILSCLLLSGCTHKNFINAETPTKKLLSDMESKNTSKHMVTKNGVIIYKDNSVTDTTNSAAAKTFGPEDLNFYD